MELGHAGSIFIQAVEPIVGGHDMVFTIRLREPIDEARLAASYERQVRAREQLRLRFVEDPRTGRRCWAPFVGEALEEQIRRGLDELSRPAGPELVWGRVPSGERLPMRLLRVDALTLVCRMTHVLTNVLGAYYWLEDLFRFYALREGVPLLLEEKTDRAPAFRRVSEALRGVGSSIEFVTRFERAAGHNAREETVDLSMGRDPMDRGSGLTIRRYNFSPEQTQKAKQRAKERGMSMTALLAVSAVDALFDLAPDKRRVCVGVPADLALHGRGFRRSDPGNITGGIPLQVFRERDLSAQVVEGLEWAKRGVQYWMPKLSCMALRDDRKLHEETHARWLRPIRDRGPFGNYSCLVSNAGFRREFMELQQRCRRVSCCSWNEWLCFIVNTVGEAMSLDVTYLNDLYDQGPASQAAERVARALAGAGSAGEFDVEREVIQTVSSRNEAA